MPVTTHIEDFLPGDRLCMMARVMYRLVFQGRLAGREPRLVREPVLWIGRDEACPLRLTEDGVSARHAAIERREDGYYLRDLDSANGVRVNHQLIMQQRLRSGDELEIGAASLRFEILHGAGAAHRTVDAVQLTAATLVALVIAGQLGLLAWIFSQPHPVLQSSPRRRRAPVVALLNNQPVPPAPVTPVAPPPPGPAPALPRPLVLTRMIRIMQIQESRQNNQLLLTLQLNAQVGERTLDSRAVGVCVQFYIRNPDGTLTLWRYPFWLKIPDWENFSVKVFNVPFPGEPNEYGGYIVRTYYRGQIQDATAKPISLLAQTPDPVVR